MFLYNGIDLVKGQESNNANYYVMVYAHKVSFWVVILVKRPLLLSDNSLEDPYDILCLVSSDVLA